MLQVDVNVDISVTSFFSNFKLKKNDVTEMSTLLLQVNYYFIFSFISAILKMSLLLSVLTLQREISLQSKRTFKGVTADTPLNVLFDRE